MRSLELFSGAGGLAKGLDLVGFQHEAFIEYNKQACISLRKNFDPSKVFEGKIQDYNFDQLKNIDIVAGGPPCQPFSLGGKHKANNDDRDMFPYAIHAIDVLCPKIFIFENVKGLLRESFSEYFQYIILRLTYPKIRIKKNSDWFEHLNQLRSIKFQSCKDIKYNVHFKLLDAADFGVPQNRERVVIVGTRSDLNINWKYPQKTHTLDRLLWDKFVSGSYWDEHKIPKAEREICPNEIKSKCEHLRESFGFMQPTENRWQTVRDALKSVPHPNKRHNISDHIYRDGAKPYVGHTGSDIDFPAKTLKAGGHGVPGGENMIRYRNGGVRYFTVYEAKLIQTFPENFFITGAWSEALRQIGNAVPVKLAEKIGILVKDCLNENPN
jgi:DNA (cytosine-5)-methyltransferase 1